MKELVKGKERTRLISAIGRSASTNENKIYVIPFKNKWGVKKEGSLRFHRLKPTRELAIKEANTVAIAIQSPSVIVMNDEGIISRIIKY